MACKGAAKEAHKGIPGPWGLVRSGSASLQFVDGDVQHTYVGLKHAMFWQQLHLQLFSNAHFGHDFMFHHDLCHQEMQGKARFKLKCEGIEQG